MHTDPKLARVWEIVEPIALEAGLEVIDIEHRRERRGAILRLLMDRPGGVSLDELATMSRHLSDTLDAHENVVPGAYTLEVSSPGINRPLTKPRHFEGYVGKRVHVRTKDTGAERHSFKGTLIAVGPEGIEVELDDGSRHEIAFATIARANYQHEFAEPGHKPRSRRKPRGTGAKASTAKETSCSPI